MKKLSKYPEPNMSDDTPNPGAPPAPARKKINLREAIEDTFDALGGVEGLTTWVKSSTAHTRLFYRDILPKVIPKEVQATHASPDGGPVKMVIEWGAPAPPTPAINTLASAIDSIDSDE
jgi:hypothetical protein